MIRFFKSKIGLSIALSLIFIGGAVALKLISSRSESNSLQQKIAALASESVKGARKDSIDPLEAIASSTQNESVPASSAATSTESENVTATDRFARELFTLYAEAKRNGKEIDEATAQKIADLVLSNDYSGEKKLFAPSDFKIADNTRTSAKNYGNAVGSILSTPRTPGDQELVILERVRERGITEADAITLARILDRYRAIENKFQVMAVPEAAASAHADLVNGIGYIADGVEGIFTLEADPIGSLTKIKRYQDGIDLMTAASLGIRDFLLSKKITFSSSEAGSILLR